MKLENKQELERLVHLVETGLDERLQVTPEVERQKRVIAAMQYSLDAGGKRIRPVLVLEFCRLWRLMRQRRFWQAMPSRYRHFV